MKRKLKHCSSLPKRMVLGASLALIATGSLWATRASSTSLHTDIVESITQQKTIKGKVLDIAQSIMLHYDFFVCNIYIMIFTKMVIIFWNMQTLVSTKKS